MRSLVAAALLVAAVAWAQPSRVGCGPAQAGCGPAQLPVSTVTTTTLANASPSWVPSMLAAWMLDEPSGTRVNAQGTTSRNLSVADAADPPSSSDHMEGTASMSLSHNDRITTDTFSSLIAPLSVGCWVKSAPSPYTFVLHNWQGAAGTFQLSRTNAGGFMFHVWDSGNVEHQVVSGNSWLTTTWAHVVGTTSGTTGILYVNGVQQATGAMGTAVARAVPFYLGDNSQFVGLVDECFLSSTLLSAVSVCRICSCGVRGEQCACSGTSFAITGRNASACGSCTLPADCTAPPT